MRKMLKFTLLGGAIGAGIGYARSTQSQGNTAGPNDIVASNDALFNDIATTAAGGAAIGFGVGFVLARRSKKKAAKKRLTLGSAIAAGGIVEAARAALPVIEHAAEVARGRAAKAAEAAKPAVEKAAEITMDKAKDAGHRVAERARSIDLADGKAREMITILT
jgi:hypothetical protein